MTKRTKPYTARGIARVPCVRCGKPSIYQWQVCADGRAYRPCCSKCDIAINRMVMKFMRIPDWQRKLAAYVHSTESRQ